MLGAWAATLLALGAGVRLWAQYTALSDPGQSADEARDLFGAMVLRTQWGRVWTLSVVLIVVAYFAFSRARLGARPAWLVAAASTIALALTPALSGHATGDSPSVPLTIVADMLHVLGAGAWLGTLFVLALTAIVPLRASAAPATDLAALVRAFSPIALLSATTLSLTGLYAAWIHLGSIGAVFSSRYGTVLLIKLAFVAGVAACGAYNWRLGTPRLVAGDEAALRHSARVELLIGALVLVATAILVGTPLPGEH